MSLPSFRDLSDLVLHSRKDIDYRFIIRDRGANVTVVAIHGGHIAPMTSELVSAIAGDEHNLYDFQGLNPDKARFMCISPTRFREMRLETLLRRSQTAVCLIGTEEIVPLVRLGGGNRLLCQTLTTALAGIPIEVLPLIGGGAAHSPNRFYNLPEQRGVLLAVSKGLCDRMTSFSNVSDPTPNLATGTALFRRFVGAIRQGIDAYQAHMRDSVDQALARFEEATNAIGYPIRNPHTTGCHHTLRKDA